MEQLSECVGQDEFPETAEDCVRDYTGLVYKVCRDHAGRAKQLKIEYEDLIQHGFIALLKAYDRYDPEKCMRENGTVAKFSTFAYSIIQWELRRIFRDYNPGAKFTRTEKEVAYKIRDNDWLDKSIEEICELAECAETIAIGAMNYIHNRDTSSIDAPVNSGYGEKETTLGDLVGGSSQDSSAVHVKEFLSLLTEREQTVMELRLNQELSQSQIGVQLNISQPHVSRIIREIGEKWYAYSEGSTLKVQEELKPVEVKKPKVWECPLCGSTTKPRGIKRPTMCKACKTKRAKERIKQNIIKCSICGDEIQATSNSAKYCDKCRPGSSYQKKSKSKKDNQKKRENTTNKQERVEQDMSQKIQTEQSQTKTSSLKSLNVDLSLEGMAQDVPSLMDEFAKIVEMLTVHQLEDIEFKIEVKAKTR